MERKIGEIFEYNGEWYQCVISPDTVCDHCDLVFSECNENCLSTERCDKADVIFKKLEKVGEPYTTSMDKTVQNYLLEIAVSVPPKDVFALINNEQRLIAIEIKQNKEDMSNTETLWYGPDRKEAKSLKLSNLKPFSLEAAKAGKPVCTRDGHKARIICFDKREGFPIVALVETKVNSRISEEVALFDIDGRAVTSDIDSKLDLMMLPEKKEGWINIYKEGLLGARIYSTKEEAINNSEGLDYIKTIKVEWEE